MKKAIYAPENDGHFALAAPYYCHFTSPIRRYPDLCIHRIIKKDIRGELTPESIEYLKSFVTKACKQSSEKERNADEAERTVDDYLKCLYMKKHLGEEFEGVVSGVTESALYVELPNTIEGEIKIADLPYDQYEYDEVMHRLAGRNRCFKLGDKMKIKVLSSNEISRELCFGPIIENENIKCEKSKKNKNKYEEENEVSNKKIKKGRTKKGGKHKKKDNFEEDDFEFGL